MAKNPGKVSPNITNWPLWCLLQLSIWPYLYKVWWCHMLSTSNKNAVVYTQNGGWREATQCFLKICNMVITICLNVTYFLAIMECKVTIGIVPSSPFPLPLLLNYSLSLGTMFAVSFNTIQAHVNICGLFWRGEWWGYQFVSFGILSQNTSTSNNNNNEAFIMHLSSVEIVIASSAKWTSLNGTLKGKIWKNKKRNICVVHL